METPEKKHIGKTILKVFLIVLLCALSAAGGFFGNEYYTRYQASLIVPEPTCTVEGHIAAGDVQVRVNGGDVQWYDGWRWTTAASTETMSQEDRYEQAREGYQAFETELLAQREAEAAAQAAETAETGEEGAEAAPVPGRVQLPEAGQKVVIWRGGGGGSSGGGGGSGGNDGQDIEWSGDYL